MTLFRLSHLYKGPILKHSHILWCCGLGPQCINFGDHNSTPNNGEKYLEDTKLSFAVIAYSLSVEDHFPSNNKTILSWEESFEARLDDYFTSTRQCTHPVSGPSE